ncbi:hypothetical protein [Streptacidiphilus sp. EB129]|uniref:hypothetical protein n=1 Tax=Streptacidiphilus sp. EB129 TaxID=3156262 RepID=UPI003516FE1B
MNKRQKLGAIGGLTVAVISSAITMAAPASAWVSQAGTYCRSSVTGSFATASFGWGPAVTLQYDSCIVATQPNAIGAIAKARNVDFLTPIDRCAQLINVAKGRQPAVQLHRTGRGWAGWSGLLATVICGGTRTRPPASTDQAGSARCRSFLASPLLLGRRFPMRTATHKCR